MDLKITNENINIAIQSIRSRKLRTTLTILIIAFGIMALTSILTSIESIKSSLRENFSMMGSNTFTISKFRISGNRNPHGKRIESEPVSWEQANEFKNRYKIPSKVSIFLQASGASTIKREHYKTNPNIAIMGIDENYLVTSGQEIGLGRSFSKSEIDNCKNVTIIGSEIKEKLFPSGESPLGKQITIGSKHFIVVGIMKQKGSSFGFSGDNSCLIPVTVARQFGSSKSSFNINVMPSDINMLSYATDEATGLFRTIRKQSAKDENNFEIRKSDNLANTLIENIKFITIAATIIGLITLVGASIGLMNIMLVSVSERKREIGVRKAMGATSKAIHNQFLIESIVIGQIGGIVGVLLGVLAGNIISIILKSSFIIPWGWILLGIFLTLIVGILSGLIPASKAAKLDPIESLRYE